MYNIYSPDYNFSGDYAGYNFEKGIATAELDDNLKLWFKMLGFRIEKAKEPIKKATKVVVKETNKEEIKAKEESEEK